MTNMVEAQENGAQEQQQQPCVKIKKRRNCVVFGSLCVGPLSVLHRKVGSTKLVVDV